MNKKYLILAIAVSALIILGIILLLSNRKEPETQVLNFVTYNEDEANLKDLIAEFEAATGAQVNFQKIDLASYEVESLNLLSTGKIDVWGLPNNWIYKHHDKLSSASILSATDYQSIYPAVIAQENIIDSQIYGLPLSFDSLVLFYNSSLKQRPKDQELTDAEEEIFSKNPSNWDEFSQQVQILASAKEPTISYSPAAIGTETIPAASDILTLLMLQYGSQMTSDDNTQATFHTSVNKFGGENYPGAKALDFYTSFAKKDHPNYAFPKTIGDPLRAFGENKITYYLDFSNKESEIKLINPDLNYSILAIPQVKETKNPVNLISYETFTVPKTSVNQTLAWQFIDFLTDKKSVQKYLQKSKKHSAFLEDLAGVSEVVEKSVSSALSWANPDAIQTQRIFNQAIADVLGGQSPQTVLEGAALQVTTLLEKIKP